MPLEVTHQQWMELTEQGLLTPRSTELKAVDEALAHLEARERAGSDAYFALLELDKALQDWMKAKLANGQDWKTSVRNGHPDGRGRGIVERLADEIGYAMANKDYDAGFTFVRREAANYYHEQPDGSQLGFIGFGERMLAEAGWKFHVCTPMDDQVARKAADDVLPMLRARGFWHKLPKNKTFFYKLFATHAEKGKFITIYSRTPAEAHEIAAELYSSDWATGRTLDKAGQPYDRSQVPPIHGDVEINGLVNVYCRYGSYKGRNIPGPDFKTRVPDNRSCGWPPWLPGWGKMRQEGTATYPPVDVEGVTDLSWSDAIARTAEQKTVKLRTMINITGS